MWAWACFWIQPIHACLFFKLIFTPTEPHAETGNVCHYVAPGINSNNPVDFFRILRVTYRKPPATDGSKTTPLPDLQDLPVIYPFTYETFTPELVRVGSGKQATGTVGSLKERLETMNETFSKVIAFLQNSGVSMIIIITVAK